MQELRHIILAIVIISIIFISVLLATLAATGSGDEPIGIRLKNWWLNAYDGDHITSDVVTANDIFHTRQRACTSLPAHKGSVGYQVELMQRYLNRCCSQHIVEDGVWGRCTEKALSIALSKCPWTNGKAWYADTCGHTHMSADNFQWILYNGGASLTE